MSAKKLIGSEKFNLTTLAKTLLFISFVYIFCLINDPRYSWVLPEAYLYKSYIMQSVPLDHIIQGAANYQVFEFSNRITRPLSSIFEIIDTHFRAMLWWHMMPMASLSLTFIFSLLLGPILFYKFLTNLKIRQPIALMATAIMLLNPGTLSLTVMLFRPAKVMMNFWLVFCLYFASKIDNSADGKSDSRNIWLVGFGILTGFLFDETALVIVTAIFFLFPKVFLGNRKRIIGFALVPATLVVLYSTAFPWMAAYYGYAKPNLLAYSALSAPTFPAFKILLSNYITNSIDITQESLALFNPVMLKSLRDQIVLSILFISLLAVASNYTLLISKDSEKINPQTKKLILRSASLILFLYLFHTLLIDTVGDPTTGRVWGPYWYASYFGIIWGMLIGLWGESIAEYKGYIPKSFISFVVSLLFGLMIVFPYTDYVYKTFHFHPYHPSDIEYLYRGDVNRFNIWDKNLLPKRSELRDIWKDIRKGKPIEVIPKEFYWLAVEMGILNKFPVPTDTSLVEEQSDFYHLPLLRKCDIVPTTNEVVFEPDALKRLTMTKSIKTFGAQKKSAESIILYNSQLHVSRG